MTQNASFGWLPPGYVPAGKFTPWEESNPMYTYLTAWSGGAGLAVYVNAKGTCAVDPSSMASCQGGALQYQVLGKAPDVSGHTAYWLSLGILAWEYSPGAWAELDGGNGSYPLDPGTQAMVYRVAENIRYSQTPIEFPWWISLPGWSVLGGVDYTVVAGRPLAVHVMSGPANAAIAPVDVLVSPVKVSDNCAKLNPAAQKQNVTLLGATGVLESFGGSQEVCVDADGLSLLISLNQPSGVMRYARMLHLLGAGPSQWTTDPIR